MYIPSGGWLFIQPNTELLPGMLVKSLDGKVHCIGSFTNQQVYQNQIGYSGHQIEGVKLTITQYHPFISLDLETQC
jgi:hypothetical protein